MMLSGHGNGERLCLEKMWRAGAVNAGVVRQHLNTTHAPLQSPSHTSDNGCVSKKLVISPLSGFPNRELSSKINGCERYQPFACNVNCYFLLKLLLVDGLVRLSETFTRPSL